jgi:DNA repair exonuclease SbcCD ATPase subunit
MFTPAGMTCNEALLMANPIFPGSGFHRNGSKGEAGAREPQNHADPVPLREEGFYPVDLEKWDDKPLLPDQEMVLRENAQLREKLSELEQLVAKNSQEMEKALAQQKAEYETLLEEKSEMIRNLHRKVQEQQARPQAGTNAPREEELLALSEELERERQILKEDEAALMAQMGQMEVQMSRERAEIARQRNELQRLQNEIRRELELAPRDASLRERLEPLKRIQQEISQRSGSGSEVKPQSPPEAPPPEAPKSRKESGLFRRLFG